MYAHVQGRSQTFWRPKQANKLAPFFKPTNFFGVGQGWRTFWRRMSKFRIHFWEIISRIEISVYWQHISDYSSGAPGQPPQLPPSPRPHNFRFQNYKLQAFHFCFKDCTFHTELRNIHFLLAPSCEFKRLLRNENFSLFHPLNFSDLERTTVWVKALKKKKKEKGE
jgi:hypothetical protein